MTNLAWLRMNVAALKRVDPYAKDILETATHVALYTFNAVNNEWEKTNIEGALFIYSRNGEPYNSVLIMNRLNTNNLIEPVTQGLDLQLQEPFLLYRNCRCNIYGIWFYDKEDCARIGAMLHKLIKESEECRKTYNKLAINVTKDSGSNMNNVDIFSMLSKAQEDFNINKNNSSSGGRGSIKEGSSIKSPLCTPITDDVSGPLTAPLGPDVTSQSVMDFFAKAKVNTGHFKAGDQPTSGATATNESKPLLARLMSHPAAHTVEHIEKQHTSITPQSVIQQQLESTPKAATSVNSGGDISSNRMKKRSRTASHQDSISTPTSLTQEVLSSMDQSASDINGTSEFLRIQSPTNVSFSASTDHQVSDIGCSNSNPLASLFAHVSTTSASEDIITAPTLSGRGSAPALIPPVMFAAPSPPELLVRPLEPLSKNQLIRAFNYLLRSDPDFINKLYEAYIKSFGEILS